MNIADQLYATARIIPIKPANKVKQVKKLESGALAVTLHSGKTYKIDREDEMFQAFVVYTMIGDL
jgi:hypothetical protein